MRALVIGGDGFIGRALVAALQKAGHAVIATSRREGAPVRFDLMNPTPLPEADVAFITAAQYRIPLRGSEESWRVNVDGTVKTALALIAAGVFVVFLSSICVYERRDAYARHKAYVEMVLVDKAAIVRLGDVEERHLEGVTKQLIAVGEKRETGVFA